MCEKRFYSDDGWPSTNTRRCDEWWDKEAELGLRLLMAVWGLTGCEDNVEKYSYKNILSEYPRCSSEQPVYVARFRNVHIE